MRIRALGALFATSCLLACSADDRGEKADGGLSTGAEDGTGDGDDDDDPGNDKFDIGEGDEGGNPGDCKGDGEGDVEFTYAWIANSGEGTVSKIDTRTATEVARYVADPNINPQPSRTAVNLYGDAVVVSRGKPWAVYVPEGPGAVTKIAARIEDCIDYNQNGQIETSQGPEDVLEFGADECVLWHRVIDSDGYENGPRPVGWEGAKSDGGCVLPNPRLWIGWFDNDANIAHFERLDGETGETLDEVLVPWSGLQFGPYGGAVDGNGDFWAVGWQVGPLVRIDGKTLEVTTWNIPTPPGEDMTWTYGMALDENGHPWMASVGSAIHFNPDTEEFTFAKTTNRSMRGVMVDREGRAWFAVDLAAENGYESCGLAVVDTATDEVIQDFVKLPGCYEPVGVSIDIDGYVWVPDYQAWKAYKVDPDTYQVVGEVEGLYEPYTYSDMTGAGLDLVTNPPQG